MADITYCLNQNCPFKDCERHSSKINKACRDGKGYVSVADYTGSCRKYIGHLADYVVVKEGTMIEAKLNTTMAIFKDMTSRPHNSWIRADEYLPDDDKKVLCWYEYFRYGNYNRMYQTYGIGFCINGTWCGEVSNGVKCRVIAWQPLPEPPQKEGE